MYSQSLVVLATSTDMAAATHRVCTVLPVALRAIQHTPKMGCLEAMTRGLIRHSPHTRYRTRWFQYRKLPNVLRVIIIQTRSP